MSAATAIKTYDVSTNVRDVTDLISVVANTETPFYSGLRRVKANGTYHEAQYHDLTTGQDNAQVEGADYTLSKESVPSTLGNYTQIFFKNAKVSKTQQAVQMYGVEDLLAQEVEWKMKELATDVEKALLQGTGNSGASGTARELTGALALISTNVETGSGSGAETLTEDMFNDALETIWSNGGRPKDVYVNSSQKRKISAFTASSTKNVDANDKKLVNSVDVYESDFGVLSIHLDAYMPSDQVLIADKSMFAVAQLRPFTVEDYPSIGSYVAKVIEGELTLECNNEKAHGKIVDLV
ncbi:MAG: phage head protein [Cyanobacteria bacterium J149]|nr:MAG: phage head protein [Cyanobacteria bacterium J149]